MLPSKSPTISASEELPLVSVFVITYNHALYIREALDSILMQEGPFELEIVVGNDCSTDDTGAIINEYVARYPHVMKLLPNDQNLGMSRNLDRCLAACRGRYIAALEGDDYWTDPEKLARQVKFLEEHPDFSFCFHNALVVYEDGSGKSRHLMTSDDKPEYTLEDITRAWNIASASVMFRNGLLPKLPNWAHEGTATDLPVFVILANQGRVGYLSEVMSVYRVNDGGVSRTGHQEKYMLGIVRMHENVDKYLAYRYHHNLVIKQIECYIILTGLMLEAKEHNSARRYLLRALRLQLTRGILPSIRNIKTFIATLIPLKAR